MLILFDFFSLVSIYLVVIASSWFLWVPGYNSQINLNTTVIYILTFILYMATFFIGRRLNVNPESNSKYLIYLIMIIGIFLQDTFGADTFIPIILVSIGAILMSTISPILTQIARTQHFTSTERTNEELMETMLQSYKYLIRKRDWLFNLILLQIAISVSIILGLTLNDILVIYLDIEIVQIIMLGVFILLLMLLSIHLFPKINRPDRYQQYMETS